MKTPMGKIASRQAHIILYGAIDIVTAGEKTRSICHCLNVCSELRDALRALAESQGEISEVVYMGFEELATQGEDAVVAAQILF